MREATGAEPAPTPKTHSKPGPALAKQPPDFLTPAEVAKIFRVSGRTVARWGEMGLLTTIRTPGGHRRFLVAEVERLLEEGLPPD